MHENRGKSNKSARSAQTFNETPSARAISHRLGQRTKTSLRTNEYEYTYGFFARRLAKAIEKHYGRSNFRQITPEPPNCLLNRQTRFLTARRCVCRGREAIRY